MTRRLRALGVAVLIVAPLIVPNPARSATHHHSKVERQIRKLQRQVREQRQDIRDLMAISSYQTTVLNCVQWMPVRTFDLPGIQQPVLSWTTTDETSDFWVAFSDRACLDRIDAYAEQVGP